ncbi:hypothetical protein GCM10023149_52020 [Mucilaginibacter gynuensis]|uniref:Uncharacterized protein n=1 Tax=Mucilaginibacter gynuensis TaxID=1302236 RepID=A0ABP8HKB3_9SPHI
MNAQSKKRLKITVLAFAVVIIINNWPAIKHGFTDGFNEGWNSIPAK